MLEMILIFFTVLTILLSNPLFKQNFSYTCLFEHVPVLAFSLAHDDMTISQMTFAMIN